MRVHAVGNPVLVRLWERAGDPGRALDAVRRTAYHPIFGEFLGWSTFARERGRLAALTGKREEAIRAYRFYLALRPNPEPSLRGDVATVRAELERLERESAGR